MRKDPGTRRTSTALTCLSRILGLMVPLGLYSSLCLLLALLVQHKVSAQVPAAATGQRAASDGVRILEASETRIVLDINLSDYVATKHLVGDRVYDVLSIPGWDLTQEAGMPQLPVRRLLLGVPPQAELQLAIHDTTVLDSAPHSILPVPERVLLDDLFDLEGSWLNPPRFETRYVESPAGYGTAGYQPTAVAQLAELAWIRNQRVAAVDLYPILYNAHAGRIRYYPQFRVEISFSYAPGRRGSGSARMEPVAFEQLFESQLLNYEQSREWRNPGGQSASLVTSADWPLSSEAYKIAITDSGLYRLTYDFLLQGGMPPETVESLDPQTIQLFSMGQEISIQVVGEEDHSFDPGDYLLFYGRAVDSKYTDRNIYWLTYGQMAGRRLAVRSGEPSGIMPAPTTFPFHRRIEENRRYLAQWPGDDSTDRWYWQAVSVLPNEPVTVTTEVVLDNVYVSTETVSSTLWISMKGSSSWPEVTPDHHAEFYVNGERVGEHRWDGNETVEWVKVDFPQDLLETGPNTLSTVFPCDMAGVPPQFSEQAFFDRFELTYQHAFQADSDQLEFSQTAPGTYEFEVAGFTAADVEVYDITEPLSVTRIVSGVVDLQGTFYSLRFSDTVPSTRTYLALTSDRWLEPVDMMHHSPANLKDSANAADYVVISHANFLQAAHELADYRASQGLRTWVVDVQDVYDEFGFGLRIPHAIRGFVQHAYEFWQPPAPAYLILLGDGTYDPKNYLEQGAISFLTPYLGFVDPWLGETATDNWFVAVSGEDPLPDLHLGRLPANSLSEAQTMVSKIMGYEQAAEGESWSTRLTFVAGVPRPEEYLPEEHFHLMSEGVLAETVPAPYTASKTYRGTVAGSTCPTASACEQQLVNYINAGTAIVNFIGHGSMIQWDSIFTRSSISSLSNASALPVMLPMTCLDGYFIQAQRPNATYPDNPSLSELLVRTAGKGAVASWGPTGLGVAYGHDQLDRGFLEALFLKGVRELGPATYAGKLKLYGAGHSLEQIEEYTIFGDPALRVKSAVADLGVTKSVEAPEQVVPGEIVTFTLAFSNAGPGIAFDIALTDLLPPELASPTVVYASPEVISQHVGLTFSWTISDLWPHAGGEIQIRAEIDSDAARLSFFNTATISSSTPDLYLANNHSQAGIGTKGVWLPLILRSD